MDPAPGALTTRSFGDTGRSIDITDFAAAVKAQNYRTDYLLFDACFMANIETLYDLRECTDYVIAAPAKSWDRDSPTTGRCRGSSPTAAENAI